MHPCGGGKRQTPDEERGRRVRFAFPRTTTWTAPLTAWKV